MTAITLVSLEALADTTIWLVLNVARVSICLYFQRNECISTFNVGNGLVALGDWLEFIFRTC